MKKILLKENKIGESPVAGCELEGNKIGLFITSLGVLASCALCLIKSREEQGGGGNYEFRLY